MIMLSVAPVEGEENKNELSAGKVCCRDEDELIILIMLQNIISKQKLKN